jgi:hypothetical protein
MEAWKIRATLQRFFYAPDAGPVSWPIFRFPFPLFIFQFRSQSHPFTSPAGISLVHACTVLCSCFSVSTRKVYTL